MSGHTCIRLLHVLFSIENYFCYEIHKAALIQAMVELPEYSHNVIHAGILINASRHSHTIMYRSATIIITGYHVNFLHKT